MAKILKNTTASDVFVADMGINIIASSAYMITEQEYLLWVSSTSIIPLVSAGTIVVNDGASDLSISDGLRFLLYPDRITVQSSGVDITKVVTTINVTGGATVTDNGNGKTTIDVSGGSGGTPGPILREVTTVMYPFGPLNLTSDTLFEADPVNDTILFLTEEIIP